MKKSPLYWRLFCIKVRTMRTARTVLKFAPCIFTATSPFKKGKYHKRTITLILSNLE